MLTDEILKSWPYFEMFFIVVFELASSIQLW